MKLFDAYKQYIIKNPKEAAYKPTSGKYDGKKLYEIVNNLDKTGLDYNREELQKVVDFWEISNYFHGLMNELYQRIKKNFNNFNMRGEDIKEFFIAILNREYRLVCIKMREAAKQQPKGTYLYQDITNPQIQLSSGKFNTMAVLEASTETVNMICNSLRFYLKDELRNENADPNMFAANVLHIYEMADIYVTFKHSYDDILYNGGFIKIEQEKKVFYFDYDSHYELRLLKAGNMMFGERMSLIYSKYHLEGKKLKFGKYVTNYRIKRTKLQEGRVTLEFGQGNPKTHRELVIEMEAAIDSFYEYLDINVKLAKLNDIMLVEALAVWTALRYICCETLERIDSDATSMYTIKDMDFIPRLYKKEHLIEYVEKLTGINKKKVKNTLESFEADNNHYNDIWTSPLILNGGYYSVPFYPIINYMPYNVIDTLLERGGYDLDERGKNFEKYIYQCIMREKHKYHIICSPSKYFGTKEEGEEIDLMVVLKNLVIIGEAKCIRYSMNPQDYYNAWTRLKNGAKQAKKKVLFVEKHPDLFKELGEIRGKKVLPIVITNYPTFVGFEHDGVYVIDSFSFISYLNNGCMAMWELSKTANSIIQAQPFYRNEDEYSANFEKYLQKNPLKEMYVSKVVVEDIPLLPQINPWKCQAKSAQYKGHPGFDINNV
ncbi:MAG: hypothetical protein IJ911_13300 [Salinivirgaceae bacterium]|nr:hypothetical protein [Salinivirgaceae bacterium]